jgi:hypothetical protein
MLRSDHIITAILASGGGGVASVGTGGVDVGRVLAAWAAELLVAHAAATFVMVGVIWFVQLVHYPLFARYGRSEFAATARRHATLTTFIVAPTMLIEALSATTLLVLVLAGGDVPRELGSDADAFTMVASVGCVALACAWVSTFLVQVPLHVRLGNGYDAGTHARLVRTNWVRTIAWSVRGVCAGWMLVLAMGDAAGR